MMPALNEGGRNLGMVYVVDSVENETGAVSKFTA
jgi:hypothetical protein